MRRPMIRKQHISFGAKNKKMKPRLKRQGV